MRLENIVSRTKRLQPTCLSLHLAFLAEWEKLKNHLPDGIFIRAYEHRIDLLKILIIGPNNTPYHNCVFLFDMYLPSEYPHDPPSLHFVSYGPKLNPNLNPDGTVCLSLLGTWVGRGVEVWNPKTSNILQLALSIQGLILGSSFPFFLEAGYDKLRGTIQAEHQAKLYNESAFLLAQETIGPILANPPKEFESIIKQHFLMQSQQILQHCRSYITETAETSKEDKSEGKLEVEKIPQFFESPSTGLRLSLKRLLPKLEESLAKNQQNFKSLE